MSRQQWEYASVVWVDATRKITKADPEFERLSDAVKREWSSKEWPYYWWSEQTFYIWLPDAKESDKRLSWETTDDDYRETFLDVLNELGAEGWEVVSNNVRNSAMGRSYGRETTSFPTRVHTLLKRPAAAG
jgi:hypothetical protein